jgi:D-cysteine desulfhydrase
VRHKIGTPTPIITMNYSDGFNRFFIKRDDLLPFSFGGNKVRIANEYFNDMLPKGCNCIISYGSSKSNLNRVIANMSRTLEIPCYIVSPLNKALEDYETFNSRLIKSTEARLVTCDRENVSSTIENVMEKCKREGLKPYYIYGDKYGNGNQNVPIPAYIRAYEEILTYEKQMGLQFDYVFHASGTGTTQAGLICGAIEHKDDRNIIGISIARNREKGFNTIRSSIVSYFNITTSAEVDKLINFEDSYICGGYGIYNNDILKIVSNIFNTEGVALDTTYTGKAFWGMTNFIKENMITNSNILFIHTGGTPLFFDDMQLGKFKEKNL